MKRYKLFNTFIFLSTLTKALIDCFIPIILYKKGISEYYIIFFLLLNYSLAFILTIPLGYLCKKITYKWMLIITSFIVGLSYYILFMKELNIINLLLFTIFHILNSHTYWISRHYYALDVLPKRDLADEVGNIVIFSTLALIPVSYIGALLINNLDKTLMLVIVVLMNIISVIPLFKIKERRKDENNNLLEDVKTIINDIPKRSLAFMVLAQFRMIGRYIFPLYMFIYIKDNFEYIGIFNTAVGIASMFFVYFFARKMDKEKKDYLILSGLLGCIVYLLKLNITDTGLILLIGLAEGIADKMYEVAFNRNLYALGHHYERRGYATAMEGLQNISRVIIIFLTFIFLENLKTMLYIAALMLVVTGIVGFDDGEGGY